MMRAGDNRLQAMYAFIKSHTKLPGLTENQWQDKHEEVVSEFLTDPSQHRLFLVVHDNELIVTPSLTAHTGIHGSDVR